jgi:malonyl CoA-acyl carrier protein transacylase
MTALHEGGDRPVCFLFSGQGSQHVGMGAGLYEHEPIYRAALDACADALAPQLGLDIRTLMFGIEQAALADTALAQPALFATEYALASLWRHHGVVPTVMLGHSVGEFAAGALAGVMSLSDAARVVAARGRLMSGMPQGGMVSVFAAAPLIAPLLPASVEIAAFNGPALCTIAGPSAAIDEALRRFARAGIDARRLRTSHAFHSAMMDAALEPFAAVLAQVPLAPPTIRYISNVTGTWITAAQATSPAYYAEHLRRPVQFAAGLTTLAADPSLLFLEVGPGQSLSALARANLPPVQAALVAASLPPAGNPADDVRCLRRAAGQLWLAGVSMVPSATARRRLPLPTYPFQRRHFCAGRSLDRAPRGDAGGEDLGRIRSYLPVWVRDDTVPTLVIQGVWLVIGGPHTLIRAVTTVLDEAGAESVICASGGAPLSALEGRIPSGILVLSGLDTPAASRSGRRLYRTLVDLAGDLESLPALRLVRVLVATCGARSVLDEPVADPEAVLVAGAALTLPAELSWLTVRTMDLPVASPEIQAALILREARVDTGGAEIAWRGGRRWRRHFDPVELRSHAPALRGDGFYLITGGLGGMGLALAAWLASHAVPVRLLLTSRRGLPPEADPDDPGVEPWARAASRTIRAIQVAGGQVLTVAADVADASAMRDALAMATARFGPVRGVIHAAGNPGSGKLAVLQDDAAVAATFAPKVDGLAVLAGLLGGVPLDFVALMGTVNGVVPAPGIADYVAANMVLDSFAEAVMHPEGWRRVFAVDWSAWGRVGMAAGRQVAPAQRTAHEALMRAAIVPEDGIAMFGRILGSPHTRVIVTSYDLDYATKVAAASPTVTSALAGSAVVPDAAAQSNEVPRPALSSGYEPPGAGSELAVALIWTELMGVTGIGANDDFFELGGHSLLATRVLSRIGQTLGAQLTLREFFDAPTPRGLAGKIQAARSRDSAATPEGSSEREEFLL